MEEEEDRPQTSSRSQHYQLDSLTHIFPIQSMKDVVATVSGYHGMERFNLIKLIAHSGASYVGHMSRSITHLVCWKFKGKKYELAEKLNTVVVNHRWIEDCIRQGKRLPEHPYIMHSGQEVGPVSLEVPLVVKARAPNKEKMVSDKSDHVDSGQPTGLDSQAFGVGVWADSFLLNEHEDSGSYVSKRLVRDKRKICNVDVAAASTKFSCKGRRLVKKNGNREALGLQLVDADPECSIVKIPRRHGDDPSQSHCSSGMTNANVLEIRGGTEERKNDQSRVVDAYYSYDDIVETKDDKSPDQKKISSGTCSGVAKSVGIDGGNHPDYVARTPTSPELSCVICWTDFSSTRGILPCGHRFCYSCIQEWADHMASSSRDLTCPLCKASFTNIMKVECAELTDQKVYSQTIPCDAAISEIMILGDRSTPYFSGQSSSTVICCVCLGREPVDMLISCNLCHNRQIHSYCLDPFLLPWACSHCKDLQMLYCRSH